MARIKNELKEYQNIPRGLIFDNTMSDRARFIYCYMAAKPEDWDFFLEPMAKELGYSVETLRKYINELCTSGWLVKGEQENSNGKFGAVEYTLKASKDLQCEETFRHGKIPTRKNTDTEKYRHGKIPTQHNKDNKQIRDYINNKDVITKEKEDKSSQKKSGTDIPPTIEEVGEYLAMKGYYDVDAEAFWNYYESNGWKVGKNKMRNWHAAIATWRKNNYNITAHSNENNRATNQQSEYEQRRREVEDIMLRLLAEDDRRAAERSAAQVQPRPTDGDLFPFE